ncbi:histidine kinase [Leifsonia sp. H3M29-4]|uniref:sensor histidine kinase n=1 Tax=Salinibacterium metalliresistens TaxID=3031321 RepID=UPI0023D9C9D9|nr:ATP-binding protein [Salinibacterium metalliresistens]MDF1479129.1 histidine kinase [Salinibacterium metalliresistens]
MLSRSVAAFGIVYGLQTVPSVLGQLDEAYPLWLLIVIPALFGWLVVTLVLSIAQVWVRGAHGTFAVLYLGALVSWPLGVLPGAEVFGGIHWLNYLITVATAMAAIAFSTPVATLYLLVTPLIYVLGRTTPQGGGASWLLAMLEGVYAVLLGGVVLILIAMLRQAASAVDTAQATAIDRYEHAVRLHATEVERVQVDSIVHDSVLTTLISAARAYTPEAKALAATMAGKAIGHLRDAAIASPADDTVVRMSIVAQTIAESASELLGSSTPRIVGVGTRSMPTAAAEAISSAAVQAMVNSLQHAGEASRWVSVRGIPRGGLEVVVGDTGRGFQLGEVPDERLGVRISIIERIANAGGRATIRSAPGEGTVITLRWPDSGAVGETEGTA